jgi:hypothetical protein
MREATWDESPCLDDFRCDLGTVAKQSSCSACSSFIVLMLGLLESRFIVLMLGVLESRARHHKRLPLLVSNIFWALHKHGNVHCLTLLTSSVHFVKVGQLRSFSHITNCDGCIMPPNS